MTLETALFATLTADAALAALVGTRIYPVIAPQDCPRPFVVYQRLNSQPFSPLTGPASLWRARVQVIAAADDYEPARAVAAAAKAALEGLTNGTGIEAARVGGESEGYAADAGYLIRSIEFNVIYRE